MTQVSRTVLVVNSGSSSLKYAVVEPDSGNDAWPTESSSGSATDRVVDHDAALQAAFEQLAAVRAAAGHPGVWSRSGIGSCTAVRTFTHRRWSTTRLIAKLEVLAPLAPLHNPPAVLGIQVARKVLPDLPHIAVFDTAFFHDLPPAAATYAIDREIARQWHIRRYGFHGTSHQYVSEQAAAFLDAPLESLNQIVLHLGNGASASAIARRSARRHVDGPDSAGGPGDGHPLR